MTDAVANETFHKVGDLDYKVDHVKKKVYHKQVHTDPAGETTEKWRDTNGDYDQFMRKNGPQKVVADLIPPVASQPLPVKVEQQEDDFDSDALEEAPKSAW